MRSLIFMLLLTLPVLGHDYWLKPHPSGAELVYGHAGERESYDPAKVKRASGVPGPVRTVQQGGRVYLKADKPQELLLEVDDGFWIKTTRGWKNVSKRKGGRYRVSEWARYFSILVLDPKARLKQTHDLPLDMVLEGLQPDKMLVQVLYKNKPLAGADVYVNHKKVATTDAQGRASVAREGLTVVKVEHKEKIEHPDADQLKLTTVLTVL